MFPKSITPTTFPPTALLVLLVAFFVSANTASAHEWTLKVEGKSQKIEAKVVDLTAKEVVLEAGNGVRKQFPINELNDEDLEYLKNIVVVSQSKVQEKLNLKQLQQEQLQNQLTYRDIWEVELTHPTGNGLYANFLLATAEKRPIELRPNIHALASVPNEKSAEVKLEFETKPSLFQFKRLRRLSHFPIA